MCAQRPAAARTRNTGTAKKPTNQPGLRIEGHKRVLVPSHYAPNSASIPGQLTIQSLAVSSTFRIVVVRCISRTPCFLTLPVEARSPPPLASYARTPPPLTSTSPTLRRSAPGGWGLRGRRWWQVGRWQQPSTLYAVQRGGRGLSPPLPMLDPPVRASAGLGCHRSILVGPA